MIRSSNIMPFGTAFVSILPLIGGMFPYGFPLFAPLAVAYCSIIIILKRIKITLGQWVLAYLILAITYILPLVVSGNIYKTNYYDVINIIVFFGFFLALSNLIKCKEVFEKYTLYFQFLMASSSTVFAIIGLYKFKLLLNNIRIPFFYPEIGTYPWGTSLVSDYNVYGLSLIFGLVSIRFLLEQRKRLWQKYTLMISGLIIFSAAAFSASRRTWIVLPIILILFAKSGLRGSLPGILMFRIKRSEFVNILAVVLVILSIFAIYTIYNYSGFAFEYTQKHYMNSMWNRFVGIRDVVGTQNRTGSRREHYAFAGELLEEQGMLGLMIGNGGEYMKQYGLQFNAEDGFGKPHNPIISAFLQSGILGGIAVVGYLILCLFLYTKNLKHPTSRYFFFLFLITSFYALTSSNTIFTKKIYILMFLLPWLINSIYSKK